MVDIPIGGMRVVARSLKYSGAALTVNAVRDAMDICLGGQRGHSIFVHEMVEHSNGRRLWKDGGNTKVSAARLAFTFTIGGKVHMSGNGGSFQFPAAHRQPTYRDR